MRFLILLSLFFLTIPKVRAQNDPTLAGLVILYTEQAKKELKNQEKVMLLESTGHIWTKEEVEATTDLQREFNTYLDSFRSIVCYAAQIYGFYHEISRLTDNMGDFTKQLSKSPTNAVAVALSSKRNTIYRELIMNSIEIVNDIRTVCLSDNKMTEKERMEIVFGIRPKLKQMNKKLQRLTKAVKYTTMSDVWYEIDESSRPKPTSKKEIAEAAKRRWKQCGKTVGYPTSHQGKVSGFSLVGLVAAAFLTFGRFGWLGKIAGAMLGMMLIGNNSRSEERRVKSEEPTVDGRRESQRRTKSEESKASEELKTQSEQSRGMRR